MTPTFLLGSGISIGAGLRTVQEITEEVLDGKDWRNDSAELGWRRAEGKEYYPHGSAELERIQTFLRWLKVQAELHYQGDALRSVNYEDLAYLAGQVSDDIYGEYENPAVSPFTVHALTALWELLAERRLKPMQALARVALDSVVFIRAVVTNMLQQDAGRVEHLGLFIDAAHDAGVGGLNVFTLNHDTVLERFLHEHNVDVVDGFGDKDPSHSVRRWEPAVFERDPKNGGKPFVRLFKLHGSVDWRHIRPHIRNQHRQDQLERCRREAYVGIQVDWKLAENLDQLGRVHEVRDQPLLLAGTFNKILGYTGHVFLELHYRFHRILTESTDLVVCGYGFGDKGINLRIAEWMGVSPECGKRKMHIIDWRKLEDTRNAARPAIAREIDGWKTRDALIYRQCDFTCEVVGWEEIKSNLIKAT